LKVIGECNDTGTIIAFKPDLTIFTDVVDFEFDQIDTRLKETAFLNAGLEIVILDERGEEEHSSQHLYQGGISEFVSQLNVTREAMHQEVIVISGEKELEIGTVTVDLALQWSSAYKHNS
jgi:DNA gyrase subunit B